MTKKELVEMTGNEENAIYAMEIVLGQMKRGFVRLRGVLWHI